MAAADITPCFATAACMEVLPGDATVRSPPLGGNRSRTGIARGSSRGQSRPMPQPTCTGRGCCDFRTRTTPRTPRWESDRPPNLPVGRRRGRSRSRSALGTGLRPHLPLGRSRRRPDRRSCATTGRPPRALPMSAGGRQQPAPRSALESRCAPRRHRGRLRARSLARPAGRRRRWRSLLASPRPFLQELAPQARLSASPPLRRSSEARCDPCSSGADCASPELRPDLPHWRTPPPSPPAQAAAPWIEWTAP